MIHYSNLFAEKGVLNIVANDERIAQDKKEPTLEMGAVFLLEEGQSDPQPFPR